MKTKRKTINMNLCVSAPHWLKAAQIRKEVQSLINNQCNYSFLVECGDIKVRKISPANKLIKRFMNNISGHLSDVADAYNPVRRGEIITQIHLGGKCGIDELRALYELDPVLMSVIPHIHKAMQIREGKVK